MNVKTIIILTISIIIMFNCRGLCDSYNIDQLSEAVLENNIVLVKEIIDDGSVDINQKDSNGKYPLEMVLVMGNCDMAKILLGAGADPFVVISEDGGTIYDKVMSEGSSYLKYIFEEYSN